MADYHLSMTGSAPSGESFDVTLYFERDVTWSLKHRIDALGKAAYEASRAVLLDDPRTSVRGERHDAMTTDEADRTLGWGEITRREHHGHRMTGEGDA